MTDEEYQAEFDRVWKAAFDGADELRACTTLANWYVSLLADQKRKDAEIERLRAIEEAARMYRKAVKALSEPWIEDSIHEMQLFGMRQKAQRQLDSLLEQEVQK